MPNLIAYAALAAWPIVALVLFRWLPTGRALIASILVAYLLLPPAPAGFSLPLLTLDKDTLPVITAAVICLFLMREDRSILPRSPVVNLLLLAFVLGPVVTVMTNREPVFHGIVGLPGLGLSDMIGGIMQQILLLVPFLLARHFLTSATDLRDLLWALVIGGLVYSLPMLVEVRLSPQMNIWVYGYFQHLFEQMTRGDGYRPIVFLYHGLWVAFFVMTSVLAAVALLRAEAGRLRFGLFAAALYLFVVLLLCKSMASIFYAVAFAPVILLFAPRFQLHIALLLAVIALAYPMAKGSGQIPAERLLTAIETVSSERSNSLAVRFSNEDVLLARAEQKPLFGWGMWGRNHILDPVSGTIMTITDGRWIIVIGVFGWFGFLAEFGLLALPVLMLWRYRNQLGEGALYIAPAAVILGVNMLDLIPNATLTPLTWLFAGALLAQAERLAQPVPEKSSAPGDAAAQPEPAFRTVL